MLFLPLNNGDSVRIGTRLGKYLLVLTYIFTLMFFTAFTSANLQTFLVRCAYDLTCNPEQMDWTDALGVALITLLNA